MKKYFYKFRFLVYTILLFTVAIIYEDYFLYSYNYELEVKKFQETIQKKEEQLDEFLKELELKFAGNNNRELFKQNSELLNGFLNERGYVVLIYQNDSLKFWSDNTIPVSNLYSESFLYDRVIYLKNGWFLSLTKKFEDKIIVGLILIKNSYPYENKFLTNVFQDDFNFPSSVQISKEESDKSFAVYDKKNNFLLSLTFDDIFKCKTSQLYLSAFIYFLSLIFLLIFLLILIRNFPDKNKKIWSFLALGGFLILIKYAIKIFHFPDVFYSLELFSPYFYADSSFSSSLGDLLISSIFIFFFFYNFHLEYSFPESFYTQSKFKKWTISFFAFLPVVLFFVLIHYLFRSIIFNSSISFEVYKVLGITVYTFIGFFVIALFFASFIFLTDKIILFLKDIIPIKFFYLFLLLFFIVIFPVIYICGYTVEVISVIFLMTIISILGFIRYNKKYHFQYSTFVLFVFLFSLITVYFITGITNEKGKRDRMLKVVNLAAEHDPVAELLLNNIDTELIADENLAGLLFDPFLNVEEIVDYLQKKYFNGFWSKYDFLITICRQNDSVLIEPIIEWHHCYKFFDDLLQNEGSPLPNSNFYFLDNLNGRISYFGSFEFFSHIDLLEITLFIELNSKLTSEELGYPELLLDDKFYKTSNISEFSYAKYNNQKLITQAGTFPYSLSSEVYSPNDEEFSFIKFDGYNHLIYNIDDENLIIISKPSLKLIDVLISFSYIFVFFYLLITIIALIRNLPLLRRSFQLNFKNKIQFSMIGILILSLLLIGGGTIYYSTKQYENKNYENISEKTQSVYIELDHKLAYEEKLTANWKSDTYDNLEELLKKFSNVFYSDINLYDQDGNLLATSRPEIFEKGLIGSKMDPEAFLQIVINKNAEFIHNENIGKLNYLSAYTPFMNYENKLLAYLNLPYFTKQYLLTKEISTLVVAVVNIYMLLILLTIAITVFISNKITQPLRLIQNKFSEIKLGKQNEPIQYVSQDEIGSLVREYNRMVVELTKSAELLAKSEREMAWREMAKQIAHEIKNPLTPMKLSLQHLQKAWKDKVPNWNEYLEKFSNALIVQVDNLSAIATEFSNFAKMPKTNYEKVDIVTKIKNSVLLFDNAENVEFVVDLHQNEKVYVYADKEQLLSVFTNLIKNAIQSIPDDKKGLIKIDLLRHENNVIVKVTDNGKGVPEELGDKLFMPNFTTKSSGMGLGLAIAKNIVEDTNGNIWYETRIGKGTTFFVELPIHQ